MLGALFCIFTCLSVEASAKRHDMSLTNELDKIENFMMVGHEDGWNHCDVIKDTRLKSTFIARGPTFVMDINKLSFFDVASSLSSSSCLLVFFHANNNQSLSRIFEFGWTVVQHRRIALVLTLSGGVNLSWASNTTRLPFMVASEMEDGKRQFLCPMVGEHEPHMQNTICVPSQVSYRHKTIKVGMLGLKPSFFGN